LPSVKVGLISCQTSQLTTVSSCRSTAEWMNITLIIITSRLDYCNSL